MIPPRRSPALASRSLIADRSPNLDPGPGHARSTLAAALTWTTYFVDDLTSAR